MKERLFTIEDIKFFSLLMFIYASTMFLGIYVSINNL